MGLLAVAAVVYTCEAELSVADDLATVADGSCSCSWPCWAERTRRLAHLVCLDACAVVVAVEVDKLAAVGCSKGYSGCSGIGIDAVDVVRVVVAVAVVVVVVVVAGEVVVDR